MRNIKAFAATVVLLATVFMAASAFGEYEPDKDLTVLRVEVIIHPSFAARLESTHPALVSEYVEGLFADSSAIAFRDAINVVYRPVEITVLEDDPIVGDGTPSGYLNEMITWYKGAYNRKPEDVIVFFTSELLTGGRAGGGNLCGSSTSWPAVLMATSPESTVVDVLLAAELANLFQVPDEHFFCPNHQNNGEASFPDGPINSCAPSACVTSPDSSQTGGVTSLGYCGSTVRSYCPQGIGLNKPERFCEYFRQQLNEVGWCLPREPVTTGFADTASCVEDTDISCLSSSRFALSVSWRDPRSGNTGTGNAKPLTSDSGYFWFFDQGNVEIVVKVLDGRPLNDHFWVFFASLTDVEFNLKVVDTETGKVKYFTNPGYNMASVGDTAAFMQVAPITASSSGFAGMSASAVSGVETALFLNQSRFKVEVDWRDPRSGNTGTGNAKPLTSDSGYFWFFDQGNVEIVVKVLEACPVNGRRWVFFGSLTDVEFDLRVTDIETGEMKVYHNPGYNMASQADTSAFACN